MQIKKNVILDILLLSLIIIPFQLLTAQEDISEPQVPIYVVCPYHEDSLRAAYEGSMSSTGVSSQAIEKRYDSLHIQLQKVSAENTAHFTWLYTLIALLGTLNIVQLFLNSRIRKDLSTVKRFEHHQNLSISTPPIEAHQALQNQEPIIIPEIETESKQRKTRKAKLRKSHK
jgi:hypothetical protein